MIPFAPTHPDILSTFPLRSFRIGKYASILLRKPKALSGESIEYLWVLAVFGPNEKSSSGEVLLVTSELSGESLRSAGAASFGIELSADPFLCVFDEHGSHLNLGQSPEWVDQNAFVDKALQVTRERLMINEMPIEVAIKKPAWWNRRFGVSARQIILALTGTAILGLLLYPPHKISNLRGTSFVRGYAWLWDLPESASIDVPLLLTAWIGILIVGGIGYMLFRDDNSN